MSFVTDKLEDSGKFLIVISFIYEHTTAGENVGLGRMDSNATDVVRVGLKHVYPFQGVVVEHADLHIILFTGKKGREFV